MILVTLGTQEQKFYRLLDAIEKCNIDDKIIVQAGGSYNYKSKKMKILKFIDYDEMEKLIDEANIIITHGGTGSILTPLKKGKKIIACARLEKYREHINDHQIELVNSFYNEGYILKYEEGMNMEELVKKIKRFKPKEYVSNTANFVKEIKKIIDNY